jgi:hypothetical protein
VHCARLKNFVFILFVTTTVLYYSVVDDVTSVVRDLLRISEFFRVHWGRQQFSEIGGFVTNVVEISAGKLARNRLS